MKATKFIRCSALLLTLILILFVSAGVFGGGVLRIDMKNITITKNLQALLSQFDYQLDDIRDHWTTDDYVFSDPGLTYGSSSAAKIKISNSWIVINGVLQYVASAETSPADTIPQGTYGAWALEVGTNGTIDEIGATANATGYASAALAVAGLPAVQSDHARLGYATVIHTGADFVGGTTEWTTAGVTGVYVDLLPTAGIGADLIQRPK